MTTFPPLAITPLWAHVNSDLVDLLDLIPEDQLNWSPKPELWNFRGILIHMISGRYGMMAAVVKDGLPVPDILRDGQTSDGLKALLGSSWERMVPFLADPASLAREYAPYPGTTRPLSGHDLAFGQLEHDIHHRADVLHYLAQLGIEHQEPDTLARMAREDA
jgi:uncharacterized damage-inducible protein DinB